MDTAVKFPLRLPLELKTWIAERASAHFRSANSEIVSILTDEKRREAEKAEANGVKTAA